MLPLLALQVGAKGEADSVAGDFAPQRPLATVRDAENKIKLPYGNCIQRGIALAARM